MKRELYEKIYEVVKTIPEGNVATYGQVAARLGNRRLARVVGNALHVNPYPGTVPCHRVVNSRGELSGAFAFGSYDEQRRRLEAEGVDVTNFKVDLKEFGVEWEEAPAVSRDCCGKINVDDQPENIH